MTIEEFDALWTPEPFSGCWLWTGSWSSNGYGRAEKQLAHRLSWQFYRGEIPLNKEVCHSCDVRQCVNPEHLFVGTHSENMLDALRKGRLRLPNRTGAAILNETRVRELRAVADSTGASFCALGRRFGISSNTARYAVLGVTWRNVV